MAVVLANKGMCAPGFMNRGCRMKEAQKAINEPNQMLASKYAMEDMKEEEERETMSPETNLLQIQSWSLITNGPLVPHRWHVVRTLKCLVNGNGK